MTEVGGGTSLQDQLPPMPTDFVIESSLGDTGGHRKKLSIVRPSEHSEPTEKNETEKSPTEQSPKTESTITLPTKMVMAKPIKLRRSKGSSGTTKVVEAKKKTDEPEEKKEQVKEKTELVKESIESTKEKTEPVKENAEPSKEPAKEKDNDDVELVKPSTESKSNRVYSCEQLLSLQNKDEVISDEVADKLCEVASLHCESPFRSKNDAGIFPVRHYSIEDMITIYQNMKDFGPEIYSLRLIRGRRGGRWETPKVVKDERSGVVVTVDDKKFSMSDMAEAAQAMEERERVFGGGANKEQPANDVFVVYPRKEESSPKEEDDEKEKEKEKEKEEDKEEEEEEAPDFLKMSGNKSWMTNPDQDDEWKSPSFQLDPVSFDSPEPDPLFTSKPQMPDIDAVLPSKDIFGAQIPSQFLPDNVLGQTYPMVSDYPLTMPSVPEPAMPLQMDLPALPDEPVATEASLNNEPEPKKDDAAFPPMPDMDVEIVTEPVESEKTSASDTQKLDDAFPELPEDSIALETEESSTIVITKTPEVKEEASAVEEDKQKEETSVPATPEKTPKKRVLTPWERNAIREEKERKARELKALRYLAQAAPGSVPVSQAMKANVREDDDDEAEINVHAGLDEATIDTLYHGRIESPARRSPSRRGYDGQNRTHNSRSPNSSRYQTGGVRYQAGGESTRADSHPPSSAEFPPLGAMTSETPAELAEQVVIAAPEVIPEPEVVSKPPVSQPDDDEMTAFFMQ